MAKTITCRVCKQRKPNVAKGLCQQCYDALRRADRCKVCGYKLAIVADGLCRECHDEAKSKLSKGQVECLMCDKPFKPKSNINRICPKCRNASEEIQDYGGGYPAFREIVE